MLRVYGFGVTADGNYYMIHRVGEAADGEKKKNSSSNLSDSLDAILKGKDRGLQFFVYSIRYHQGSEDRRSLKKNRR